MIDEFAFRGITGVLSFGVYICPFVPENDTLLRACSAILHRFLDFGIYYTDGGFEGG